MSVDRTINGKDVVFSILRDDVYVPFVCAKEIGIEVAAEKIGTKTVGDGYWQKYAYQSLGYTINLSSVLKFDDTDWTGWDFLDNMLQLITLRWQALFTDTGTGTVKRMRGTVLIERSTLTCSASDLVMNDLTLPGSGALTVSNPADDCFATITGILLVYYGGHRYIRVTGHTGSISRYDYEIDGGGFDSHFPVSFIPDLVIQDALPSGTHHVTIIPYCANGNQGTQFDADFEIPIVYEVNGRVASGATTDACGGALTALWGTFGVGNILYTDEAMTAAVSGFDFIVRGADIFSISGSGVIGADTTDNCASTIKSNWYRIKTTVEATCSQPLVRLYTSGVFGVGAFMFYDAAYTMPVTGATRIVRGVQIYNIDFDTGQVGSTISVCPNGTPDDYILAVGASICDAPIVTYYTTAPFAVGVIVYTDIGFTSPLLTYDEFANADTGIVYNMDDTTGQVLTPTGVDCTPSFVEVLVKLGNDAGTVCDGAPVTKYMATGFAVGETLHNNNLLNDATVGFAFVVGPDGHIYNLNNTTGVIGTDTGVVCGTALYSMYVSKEDITDNVGISVTDLTTSTTISYNFNEDISSKDFLDIFQAGHLYDISVNAGITRTITISDGLGTIVASGNSTVIAATNVDPATGGVTITIAI